MVAVVVEEQWRGRIRAARERLGWSRREAAARSGLSETTWRNVETGVQHIASAGTRGYSTTAATVAKMAATVGLPPATIVQAAGFDPTGIPVQSVPVDTGDASGDVRVIMIRGTLTDEEILEQVRRMLEGNSGGGSA